jgi:hypothetical protein
VKSERKRERKRKEKVRNGVNVSSENERLV